MSLFRSRQWKQGVLFIVVCMLFAVVYFVWTFDGDMPSWPFILTQVEPDLKGEIGVGGYDFESVVAVEATSGTSFDTYRIVRMQGTSRRIETIRETLQNDQLSQHVRDQMTAVLVDMVEQDAKEREIEAWIVARGFADALVFSDEDAVEVMLPERLSLDEINRIGDFVSRTMGIPMEKISIIDGVTLQ